jgi:glycosyltransferase involved in cell wall biosynthesis
MTKIKNSIIHVNVGALSHSIHLNNTLNNNNHKSDFLTMYPLFKIDNNFRKNNTIISKSFFSTLYFFLYKFEKYNFIKKINSIVQKIAYSRIEKFILNSVDNYNIFIIQASLGKRSLPFLKNKIILLNKWSAHVVTEEKIAKEEFMKKNIKIPYQQFGSSNKFQYNQELNEYKLANKIIVPSKFAYKSFIDEGFDPSKLKIIELAGFNSKNFYPTSHPTNKTFEILYVGRITLNKGIAYLIESFKKINIENKRLRMFGIIEQDIKKYLKNIKLPDNIEILKPIKHENLKYLYSKSNVLVQPSLFDGWSMVVTEALACGCPVVTTRNTGASDIVKEGINGYVVPIMDSEAITEGIYKIYNDEKKLFLERDQIAKTVDIYKDWDKYSSNYRKFIETI